jgi:arylsulfatase A-like enzyme
LRLTIIARPGIKRQNATVEHFQTNIAIELMRTFSRNRQPFSLTVQYWRPHEPSRPTTRYPNMYPADSTPLVNSYHDDLKKRPRQYTRHRDEFECWYYGSSRLGPEKWREVTAKYYAYTTMIDDQILREGWALCSEPAIGGFLVPQ